MIGTQEKTQKEPTQVLLDNIEIRFHGTSEKNVYTALLAAIETAAAEFVGLPDMVVMNLERRFLEVHPKYWHTVVYDVIPIELRSPNDNDVPEQVRGVHCPYSLFICIRRNTLLERAEKHETRE